MLELIDYLLRILPGLLLIGLLYVLFKGKQSILVRIFLLILGFILVRDAMTPAGFWQFGVTNGVVPWIRFVNDPLVVGLLGATALVLTLIVVKTNTAMKPYLKWGPISSRTVAWGLLGGAAIALPFMIAYQFIPLGSRGGEVALVLLPALLGIALLGNLMEEVLFRGYLQGYLEKLYTPLRAALLSALTFAAGHIFLAATVTDLGPAILAFTLYEGLICAFLRLRHGIWPAAIAHGTGIFILASGLM